MVHTVDTYHELTEDIYIYGAERAESSDWSASHAHILAENAIQDGLEYVKKNNEGCKLETRCEYDSITIPSDNPNKVWDKLVPAKEVQERRIVHDEPHYSFGNNPCGECLRVFDNAKRYINGEKF